MLPKKVEWSVLAQCDLFAVQRLVETPDRPAMKTIEPMLETIFERKLKKEAKWKNTYDAITRSYKELSPNFEIQHDRFGGYRLIYKGKTILRTPAVMRRNPVGFVAAIPDGVVTDLSVMSS